MRVLMLNNEFPPLGGGTGTVNRALLQCFASMPEIEIDLFTSTMGKQKEDEQFAEHIRILKVPVNNQNIHHSSNHELLTYAIRTLPLVLKYHHKQPYDFCFAWSAVPAGGIAIILHKLARLPYLLRVSGPDIPGFERRYRAIYPILSPIIRGIWRGAEVVVAKCQLEADMIHAVDDRVQVTLIANGVDLTSFRPGAVLDEGPLRLLCVARLIERKGQHHLLEAMKRLIDENIDVTLDLVGEGDARVAYEAQVQALGISKHVRLLGYVPRAEMPAHYAAAHAFVLASYNEGMSVATLEAMAAGLPVVVTHTGGTAELVEEGINGSTFDWGDVDTLTDHLRHLATDRRRACRMGAASRACAALFSWDAAAEHYLKLFEAMPSYKCPLQH